jgi:hypothetical protein
MSTYTAEKIVSKYIYVIENRAKGTEKARSSLLFLTWRAVLNFCYTPTPSLRHPSVRHTQAESRILIIRGRLSLYTS